MLVILGFFSGVFSICLVTVRHLFLSPLSTPPANREKKWFLEKVLLRVVFWALRTAVLATHAAGVQPCNGIVQLCVDHPGRRALCVLFVFPPGEASTSSPVGSHHVGQSFPEFDVGCAYLFLMEF